MGPPHTSGATRTRGEQEKCTSCNMADWQEEHECLLAKALAAVVGAAVAAAVRAADSLPPPRHRERERERERCFDHSKESRSFCATTGARVKAI